VLAAHASAVRLVVEPAACSSGLGAARVLAAPAAPMRRTVRRATFSSPLAAARLTLLAWEIEFNRVMTKLGDPRLEERSHATYTTPEQE
jgi:hypothetical protein